jgi:gluconolactonase
MKNQLRLRIAALGLLAGIPLVMSPLSVAQTPAPPPAPMLAPSLPPNVEVDLMTNQGSAMFGAQWRTMEAKIVEVPPIPEHLPGYNTAYDIAPHASDTGFDDSKWPAIEAKDLAARRGGGHVSFIWFRSNVTIPAKIGDFDTTGAKAVFTVAVDDYAEVWVNGQMPRAVGITSPATIQGFNTPNRVVLSNSVKPGDKFQIAVFGINGPISVAPANTVWFREARLQFYK